MTQTEFDSEMPVVFARWNRRSDDSLAKILMDLWAKELQSVNLDTFRKAIARCALDRPDRFPTIGMVKHAVGDVIAAKKKARRRETIADWKNESPTPAPSFRIMATDLDDLCEWDPKMNRQPSAEVQEFYRLLAAHWRQDAARVDHDQPSVKPRLSTMMKQAGMLEGGLLKSIPPATRAELEAEADRMGIR